jgi:hypothetical protein
MESQDFALLLTALNRIAEELHQSNVLATIGTRAPCAELPFDAYADFDPASISARGAAKDKYGWTEIEWGMRTFYRRRSGEDDERGEAIRFTRCVSGNSADKSAQNWETLVRFRDRKAPKKLTSDQAERISEAAQKRQSPPHVPSVDGALRTTVPLAPSAPITKPTASNQPLDRWQAARKLFAGDIPHWLGLADKETSESIGAKADALVQLAAAPAEAISALVAAGLEHAGLVAKAGQHRIDIGASLAMLLPTARLADINAMSSTINDIINADLRKRQTAHAPAVTQTGAPVSQARSVGEFGEWFESSRKRHAGDVRPPTAGQRQAVWLSLKVACSGDEAKLAAIVRLLGNESSFKDVADSRIAAMYEWLKPSQQNKPTYQHAAAEVAALLESVSEVQPA